MVSRDWIYDPSFALNSDHAIYQKILRDPVAAHAMRYRRHLAAGTEWTLTAHSSSEEDERAAAVVEALLKNLQGFTDARICLNECLFRGSSYAFIEGAREMIAVGDDAPRAWWVPTALKDVDRRRFRQAHDRENGVIDWQMWNVQGRRWDWLDHPEWFVRCVVEATEDSLGYGRGLLDTLYLFQASKARVLRDAMAASARFGQGMILAKVNNLRGPDGRPTATSGRDGDSVAAEWLTVLRKMTAEHGLVFDSRDEVKLLTGIGEGFQLLDQLRQYLDASQVMAVLGATVQTMEPKGGSFALAKEQANSTEALIQADRKRLGEALTRDLIGQVWRLNRLQLQDAGLGAARPPELVITQGQREDPTASAQVISSLLAAGVPLRADEVYRKTGFTVPTEDDEVIEPQKQAEPGAMPDLSGLFKARNGNGLNRLENIL
jgi:hypothetical protein